jgi:hypothetical protein
MPQHYDIVDCCEQVGYRYRLDVSTRLSGRKTLLVVQLNPSRANSQRSDATVGKVVRWTQTEKHNFARVVFVNLFAKRATHPEELSGCDYRELTGSDNDSVTRHAVNEADRIIVAWGRIPRSLRRDYWRRHKEIQELIGARPVCAVGGLVGDEFPRHGRAWNRGNRDLRRHVWGNA